MDPVEIVREIGGGLAAVVIVAQGIAIGILYRRNNQQQDKMLDMALSLGKENSDLVTQNITALGASAEISRQAVRVMEKFK